MKPRRSCRKWSDCTMRGGAVHFAPFGASGMSTFHGTDFGTTVVNPIHLPSGDQRMSAGALSTVVICDVAPSASIQRTWICVPDGLPSVRNAMRVPSGDQIGLPPLARNRFFEPSVFMIHSDDSNLSSSLLTQRRA